VHNETARVHHVYRRRGVANALESKRLGLLHELFPHAALFGVLLDPKFPPANLGASELRAAASTIGQPLTFLNASTDAELDAAFAALRQQHVTAILLIASPFFDTRHDKIITFAAQQKLPTMYHFREYVVDGGLMSYGPSLGEALSRGRHLHGEDSKWRDTGGSSRSGIYQVGTGHQPKDREEWKFEVDACQGRRGDRIGQPCPLLAQSGLPACSINIRFWG
jgi:hypothetical protein